MMREEEQINQKINREENISEWASKKEVIKTSFPIYLTLGMIKFSPKFFTNFIIKCTTLFYFLFNRRAKEECLRYQNQFIKYFSDSKIKKPNVFKQIEAFAITFLEKMECWVKKNPSVKIQFQEDDVYQLINALNDGKGAFIICSHLGNSEILRNLASNNQIYLKRKIPQVVLMDLSSTKNFTNTIEKINPEFTKNIIDINSINLGTIEVLQETINNGGIVISAGDRISKNINSKFIKADFLGKNARWSYGVFLIAMLLKAPTYFMFGLREKDLGYNRKYNFYITKSSVETNCLRKDRETNIEKLCLEYVKELEEKCKNHPFQWYNFYDFWK